MLSTISDKTSTSAIRSALELRKGPSKVSRVQLYREIEHLWLIFNSCSAMRSVKESFTLSMLWQSIFLFHQTIIFCVI